MKAHELLASCRAWTQNALARYGAIPYGPHDEHVDCWCALGAIGKCYTADGDEFALRNFELESAILPVDHHYRVAVKKLADWICREHGAKTYGAQNGETGMWRDESIITDWNDDTLRTFQDVHKALVECDL